MLKIKNNREIIMTKGDDVFIDFKLRSANFPYEFYEMQDGETYVLSVKKTAENNSNNPVLFQSILENEQFFIPSEATKDLKCGSYWYDVQFISVDGLTDTVIPASPLILTMEVG